MFKTVRFAYHRPQGKGQKGEPEQQESGEMSLQGTRRIHCLAHFSMVRQGRRHAGQHTIAHLHRAGS